MVVALAPAVARPVVAMPPACATGTYCCYPASLVMMGRDATLATWVSPESWRLIPFIPDAMAVPLLMLLLMMALLLLLLEFKLGSFGL